MPRRMTNHPAEVDLLTLALGRGAEEAGETEAHVAGCPTCARRRDEFGKLASAVILDAAIDEDLAQPPALPVSLQSGERRERLAHLAAESDAAVSLADALVESLRDESVDLAASVRNLLMPGDGRLALLYACQRSSVAAALPRRALALAEAVRDATTDDSSADLLRAEADLLASQALLNIGRLAEARAAASSSRTFFRRSGANAFTLAIVDYYEASVMSFEGQFGPAERLLKAAARTFSEFAQDHWLGRAEAMLALTLAQRGNHARAVTELEAAIERLDPKLDANSHAAALLARARYLAILGRFEASRQGFAQALLIARNNRLDALVFAVRQNLAELDLLRGDLEKALASYRAVAEEADRQGLEEDQVVTRLAAAECLGRLGRYDEMMAALREVGRRVAVTDLAGNPAWSELVSRLDPGDVEVGLVSDVRAHLEAARDGFVIPFRRIRRA